MKSQLEPLERLLLWKIIFLGYEPALSKTKPKLVSDARRRLLDMGLIEIEKRGRSSHLVLTDNAWLWASENLEAEISTRSYESGPILQTVLARLKVFLAMKELRLAEFLEAKIMDTPESSKAAISSDILAQPLEERIRDAYQKISRGRWNTPVRIADIRKALADVPRVQQDKELHRLKREDRILLFPMEDPQDRTPEDEAAALAMSDRTNHLILFER